MSSAPAHRAPHRAPTIALMVAVPCAAIAVGALAAGLHALGATPADAWPWTLWGVGAAALTGLIGSGIKALAARPRGDDDGRTAGTHLQAAMLGDFLLHLVVIAAALFALRQASVKFTGLFGFGVAFAAAAFVVQVAAGLVLARWLRDMDVARAADRSTSGAPADTTGTGPVAGGEGAHAHPSADGRPTTPSSPSRPSTSRPSRHP